MSDANSTSHPAEFVRLCDEAVRALEALKRAPPLERGGRIPPIQARLAEIAARVAEMDLRTPAFHDEQGWLVDAASKLQAIDLDRGGPHVARFVDQIVADLRHIATG